MKGGWCVLGVEVRVGDARFRVRSPVFDGPIFGGRGTLTAGRSEALLSVPGVASFAIRGGEEVAVEAGPSADDASVEQLLHGPVAVILLGQQGRFALHGSTVAVEEAGVAIAGDPGAGKTTTALGLAARGHRLVADDVSVLGLRAEGPPEVQPSGRALHVWPSTARSLGLQLHDHPMTAVDHGKFIVPIPLTSPVPLRRLVVVVADREAAEVTVEPVAITDAFALATTHLWAARVVCAIWPVETLAASASLAQRVPFSLLRRPSGSWSLDQVADEVERLVASAGAGTAKASSR